MVIEIPLPAGFGISEKASAPPCLGRGFFIGIAPIIQGLTALSSEIVTNFFLEVKAPIPLALHSAFL